MKRAGERRSRSGAKASSFAIEPPAVMLRDITCIAALAPTLANRISVLTSRGERAQTVQRGVEDGQRLLDHETRIIVESSRDQAESDEERSHFPHHVNYICERIGRGTVRMLGEMYRINVDVQQLVDLDVAVAVVYRIDCRHNTSLVSVAGRRYLNRCM